MAQRQRVRFQSSRFRVRIAMGSNYTFFSNYFNALFLTMGEDLFAERNLWYRALTRPTHSEFPASMSLPTGRTPCVGSVGGAANQSTRFRHVEGRESRQREPKVIVSHKTSTPRASYNEMLARDSGERATPFAVQNFVLEK